MSGFSHLLCGGANMSNANISISTYNCRGLRGHKNRNKIFEWLRGKDHDIIFLQEAHCSVQDECKWRKEWNGDIYYSHGTRDARGVMILLKNNINIDVIDVSTAANTGRTLYVSVNIYGIEMLLVNIYAPNEDNAEFYENLFKEIGEYNIKNIALGGDFNLVLDVNIDKSGGLPTTNEKARAVVLKHMANLELIDVWRVKNPQTREYTWRRRKPHMIQCRLDFFLLAQSLCNRVRVCKIGSSFLSDHSTVHVSMKLDRVTRGPGYWKLNCSLLKDKEYVTTVKQVINECETLYEETDIDEVLFWETLKMNIRSATIQYSCKKKKLRIKRELELEECIKQLESRELLDEETEELEKCKQELSQIIDNKIEGDIIRSRARTYEENEKSSKYFLSLEKHNQEQKTISLLTDSEGNILCKQEEIRKEIELFYTELYKRKVNTCMCDATTKDVFFDSVEVCLTQEESETCEGYISKCELLKALKETSNNKSPGIDGIPTDFYKVFWNDIAGHLLAAVNKTYDNGELSVNHRRGIISIIPKKNKDPLYIKNWRPITLLCADYKLISKVIANRIKDYLPKLINCDQTGFVKGRYIGQNIDLLLQIIEYSEDRQVPGIVLGVDYAKAYDQLSWTFIEDVLKQYKFGNMLITWVKLFFNNISATVNVNGWFSQPIEIQQGVKQGDPSSPYIFILCAEVFAEYIRKSNEIKGICIGKNEYKISMLADDTNIFINYCEKSLNAVLKALESFSTLSGLKINFDKSMAYCIGVRKEMVFKTIYPIKWCDDVIETLGVIIPLYDRTDMYKINYEPKLAAMENVIRSWASRNLSLRGKVTVIKSLLMSQLQYVASVLGKPDQGIIRRIDRIVYKFLWNGSEKIKRKVMMNTREEGGLYVPDFETICQCAMIKWVYRYVHMENCNWKQIVDHALKCVGGTLVFKCNLKREESIIKNIQSSVWRKIVYSWCVVNYVEKSVLSPNDIIWLNSNLETIIVDKDSADKGLLYVRQVYDGSNVVPYESIKNKYGNITNIIYYHNIVQAIRKKYTDKCEISSDNERQMIIQTVLNKPGDKLIGKRLYKYLISRKAESNEVAGKWNHIITLDEDNHTVFNHIDSITIVNKLRSFQFKFLHRILYFNERLFKCKIGKSTLCDFCSEAIDSIDHRYFYCNVTQEFWTQLTTWIQAEYNEVCYVNNIHNIITNMYNESPLMETIVLNAKYFIYSCFLNKVKPDIIRFRQIVHNIEKTERYIAIQKDLLHIHTVKWSNR